MSEIAHTRAPWKVISAEFGKGRIVRFEVRMPEQVLSKADADLIEAAPLLLPALKAFLAHMEQDRDSGGGCLACKPLMKNARKAIAKAEGTL